MHSMTHGRCGDHRPSRGSRNAAAVDKLRRSEAPGNYCLNNNSNNVRDFAVPDQFEPTKRSSSPRDKHRHHKIHHGDGARDRGNCDANDERESIGSSPTPPPELEHPAPASAHPQPRSPRRSPRARGGDRCSDRNDNWDPPIHLPRRRSPRGRSPRARCSDSISAGELLGNFPSPTTGGGCRVTEAMASGRSSSRDRKPAPPAYNNNTNKGATSSAGTDHDKTNNTENGSSSSSSGEPQKAELADDEGDGGGYERGYGRGMLLSVDVPYPAKWRCFGRRPPAVLEYRPMGEPRTRNVRPAGKQSYLMRKADEKRGADSRVLEGDSWDNNYGLAKPVTERWTSPLPYGETRVIRTGDVDPWFSPSRGDLIVINPAQNYYRAMKSGYVMSLRGRYSFGIGDLVLRVGKFLPNGQYIPYGNLELYMYAPAREWRFLGRQPYLLVDFNYHNLDYESPGKYLAIGTFLTESFKPRRGDIIIRGGAWAENYPNKHRRHHTSVKYWKPNMEFMPNDMLLRPYVDLGRCETTREFYWGAAELYSYSGKGLAWAYWGRDHHVCDTPYPGGDNEPIKTGHHKDETGHYGSHNFELRGA